MGELEEIDYFQTLTLAFSFVLIIEQLTIKRKLQGKTVLYGSI